MVGEGMFLATPSFRPSTMETTGQQAGKVAWDHSCLLLGCCHGSWPTSVATPKLAGILSHRTRGTWDGRGTVGPGADRPANGSAACVAARGHPRLPGAGPRPGSPDRGQGGWALVLRIVLERCVRSEDENFGALMWGDERLEAPKGTEIFRKVKNWCGKPEILTRAGSRKGYQFRNFSFCDSSPTEQVVPIPAMAQRSPPPSGPSFRPARGVPTPAPSEVALVVVCSNLSSVNNSGGGAASLSYQLLGHVHVLSTTLDTRSHHEPILSRRYFLLPSFLPSFLPSLSRAPWRRPHRRTTATSTLRLTFPSGQTPQAHEFPQIIMSSNQCLIRSFRNVFF